jgi:hypothetical protein
MGSDAPLSNRSIGGGGGKRRSPAHFMVDGRRQWPWEDGPWGSKGSRYRSWSWWIAPADLCQVEATCALHGLKQTSVLAAPLYLVRGVIEPDRIPELMKVPGVRSVERDRYIQFPPAPTR